MIRRSVQQFPSRQTRNVRAEIMLDQKLKPQAAALIAGIGADLPLI